MINRLLDDKKTRNLCFSVLFFIYAAVYFFRFSGLSYALSHLSDLSDVYDLFDRINFLIVDIIRIYLDNQYAWTSFIQETIVSLPWSFFILFVIWLSVMTGMQRSIVAMMMQIMTVVMVLSNVFFTVALSWALGSQTVQSGIQVMTFFGTVSLWVSLICCVASVIMVFYIVGLLVEFE